MSGKAVSGDRLVCLLLTLSRLHLSERSCVVRYHGAKSVPHSLPGGAAQGDELGQILFLVAVSDAGMDPPPPLPLPHHPGDLPSVPAPPPPAVTKNELRVKFIDDLTFAECIQLQEKLEPVTDRQIGPLNFHDRNGLYLPPGNSCLQARLTDLENYVTSHGMKINEKKSQIIPFNFTKKYDFTPSLVLNKNQIDVVHVTKLLGTYIQSNCKWDVNTSNIVRKANTKTYFIRRLKKLGASEATLVDIYSLFIRSGLELSAPLWHYALTKGD